MLSDKILTKIEIVWQDCDVIETAKEMGITLSKEEISDVLFLLKRTYDTTLGITWETIEYNIDDVVSKRKRKK